MANQIVKRPAFVTDDQLVFLDNLRLSAITNMFGAGVYIQQEYPFLGKQEAKDLLMYWMRTFTERNPK